MTWISGLIGKSELSIMLTDGLEARSEPPVCVPMYPYMYISEEKVYF